MSQMMREPAYRALVDRLNKQSTEHYYLAYGNDIPWDNPFFEINPDDPQWLNVVNGTPFLKGLLESVEDRRLKQVIAIRSMAHKMKVGIHFENILQRGLLELANALPNGVNEFRYAHHEIVEESQHSMMFQEFVNRSQMDVRGIPGFIMGSSFLISLLGRFAPNLFMFFVLLGEAPIDYEQKKLLKQSNLPPIIDKLFRIHTTEESRHIGFATAYVKRHLPQAAAWKRFLLSLILPPLAFIMTFAILAVPFPELKGLPIRFHQWRKALAYGEYRQHLSRSLLSVRTLAQQLGLMNPVARFLWRVFGLKSPVEVLSNAEAA